MFVYAPYFVLVSIENQRSHIAVVGDHSIRVKVEIRKLGFGAHLI